MAGATDSGGGVDVSDRDIQFECSHCQNILVVDRDGVGLRLNCPFCGGPVQVPSESDPKVASLARREASGPAVEEPVVAQAAPGESPPPAAPAAVATPPEPRSEPESRGTPEQQVAPEPKSAPVPRFDFSDKSPDEIEARAEELARLMKENASQRVELQGYINKAMIELHRFQLRLKSLVERQHRFEAESAALSEARKGGRDAASAGG